MSGTGAGAEVEVEVEIGEVGGPRIRAMTPIGKWSEGNCVSGMGPKLRAFVFASKSPMY